MSGPTLNPGSAIRSAQLQAREALADRTLEGRVLSTVKDSGNNVEISTELDLSGVLNDSVVVKMWTEWGGSSRHSTDREIFAMACPRNSGRKPDAGCGVPLWVLGLPAGGREVCALGVAGPVMRFTDQEVIAADDGAMALAEAIQLDVDLHVRDTHEGLADVISRSKASDALVEQCRQKLKVKERWADKTGKGPLNLEGTLFVLVCMDKG